MDPNARYLRLFNLKKYREIQPVIESIANRSVDCQQVIPLVKTAIETVEHDGFEKYNDPDYKEHFFEDLQEMLEVLQKGELFPWFDNEQNMYILRTVVLLICCPDFQELSTFNEVSGTKIDYRHVFYGNEICDLDLMKALDDIESSEEIPIMSLDTRLHIFGQIKFTEIDKGVHQDILVLTQLNIHLDEREFRLKEIYLSIYFNIRNLTDRVKSNDDYALLNEYQSL